ncbi:MAG: permease [Phycisphaerales bacterium JB037]
MTSFLETWGEAAMTSLGFFWMALWAFALGYTISSVIQVFVTRERMRRTMGDDGPRAMALATFFGFVSSSCSFAALSSARALFQKGAGLAPALAFLLASTNLVIELGILIFIFLAWQFVLGEYLGGLLLIGVMWILVRLTLPKSLAQAAREHARAAGPDDASGDPPDPGRLIRTREGWRKVGKRYFMEWHMVWKDVTFGFTVAGVIAAFVPPAFFRALFIGSGPESDPAWWQVILHTLIGPLAAFFTFIGSMGNIPLAAILFGSGVSFAGVMAFIFSDLVVFPVLRISARYFGWKMAAYILGVFLVSLSVTALVLHAGFGALGLTPDPSTARAARTEPGARFSIDYTFFLNIAFVGVSVAFALLSRRRRDSEHDRDHHQGHDHRHGSVSDWMQRLLLFLAITSFVWLGVGLVLWFVV